MKVGIICAQGLEECEALIVYDLLYRSEIDVKLVGLENEIVSSHNVNFKTHLHIDDFKYEEYDAIVLPGGMPGTLNLENDPRVNKIIDYYVANHKLIAAICAAPSILIHKGLLKPLHFTCYPGFECGLKPANKKAIKDNNIITGIGLGGAFDFAYLIIEALLDQECANKVYERIKY